LFTHHANAQSANCTYCPTLGIGLDWNLTYPSAYHSNAQVNVQSQTPAITFVIAISVHIEGQETFLAVTILIGESISQSIHVIKYSILHPLS
jgi:hypothetical protein